MATSNNRDVKLAVEIQATGEKRGFSRAEFDRLFELAQGGCDDLFVLQRAALEAALKG